MPYEFEANIPQLQENLRVAKAQLEDAKRLVKDTIQQLNSTEDKRRQDELRNFLNTARNTVQYWSAQHTEALDALKDAQ